MKKYLLLVLALVFLGSAEKPVIPTKQEQDSAIKTIQSFLMAPCQNKSVDGQGGYKGKIIIELTDSVNDDMRYGIVISPVIYCDRIMDNDALLIQTGRAIIGFLTVGKPKWDVGHVYFAIPASNPKSAPIVDKVAEAYDFMNCKDIKDAHEMRRCILKCWHEPVNWD